MLDALHEYLATASSPEYMAAVEEAYQWFERFGLDDYDTAYMDLLMTFDNMDPPDAVDQLNQLTTELQHYLLKQQEVEVDEDLTVAQLNVILKMLSDIQDSELVDDISNIVNQETDTVDRFCGLLGLMTSVEPAMYYDQISSISEALLQKIKDQVTRNAEDDPAHAIDVNANREYVGKLQEFRLAMEDRPLIAYNLLIDGVLPGRPFSEYYDTIIPFLPTSDPKNAAVELYAAALISKDMVGDVREKILQALNKTYTSIDIITPIVVELDQLLLNYHVKLTSGIKEVTTNEAS